MTREHLLGAYVIATNERGGRWRGRCCKLDLWGCAVVECEAVDIGYGWHKLGRMEERVFEVEQVEVDNGHLAG